MTTTSNTDQLVPVSSSSVGDPFINLVEAATLRQSRNAPVLVLNTSNPPAFSSAVGLSSGPTSGINRGFPATPYVNVIPVFMVAPPGALPYGPFPSAGLPTRMPEQLGHPRTREQALRRYQEKRNRVGPVEQ
jgi:hypothetical protein